MMNAKKLNEGQNQRLGKIVRNLDWLVENAETTGQATFFESLRIRIEMFVGRRQKDQGITPFFISISSSSNFKTRILIDQRVFLFPGISHRQLSQSKSSKILRCRRNCSTSNLKGTSLMCYPRFDQSGLVRQSSSDCDGKPIPRKEAHSGKAHQ